MKTLYLSLLLLPICWQPTRAQTRIDTSEAVAIGGIQQHISIKGRDSGKPLLLWLHGGPGRSLIAAAPSFSDQLEENFVVVHWDQRETGQTLELNPSDQELSVELLQNDAYELVQFLLKRFHREKLFLVSHSWGSVLGFDLASRHPDLLNAYIAISPIIDYAEHTQLTIQMLKDWAKENDNQIALKELDSVNIPIQNKRDLFYQQKWLFIHNGVDFASKAGFRAEYYGWMDVWFPMLHQSFQNNMFESLKTVDCPIYFLEGNGDGHKSHLLVEQFYEQLKAKHKEFFWFTQSGHTVFNTEPEKLQQVIIGISRNFASK